MFGSGTQKATPPVTLKRHEIWYPWGERSDVFWKETYFDWLTMSSVVPNPCKSDAYRTRVRKVHNNSDNVGMRLSKFTYIKLRT